MLTIYHNNRCSKSRQTLALIKDRGLEPSIIHYLDKPPSKEELREILSKLNLSARDIIRTGEDAYKTLGLSNKDFSDEYLIDAIISHPKLLQRPIVVSDERAIVGRPPENVLELL